MIDSAEAASVPWPLLMLANPMFWYTALVPCVAGLISLGVARLVSRRAAIIVAAIMVIPWSVYWFVKSVPGLSDVGLARAVTFIACLTLVPSAVASLAGIGVGASRRPASIALAVTLVLGVAIVAAVASSTIAFSLIDLVNAQG